MLSLDANVVLRYLLEDSEKYIAKSKDIIENNIVFIRNEVLAEVVYVLNKTYKVPKVEVKNSLIKLLMNTNVLVDDKDVTNLALKYFDEKNIDFIDSVLCAYNRLRKENVVTFDKKLNKCMGQRFTM